MIIREYRCRDCSTTFESSDADPQCPECSRVEIDRVFLTPTAIRGSAKTAIIDRELKNLAADYGMSDISNKNGTVMGSRPAPSPEAAPQFATGSPQAAQMLAKLGSNADSFSPMLPGLRAAGGPRNWHRSPDRK